MLKYIARILIRIKFKIKLSNRYIHYRLIHQNFTSFVTMELFILSFVFLLIALFYSSVAFGGGSSYIAILSFILPEFYEIRTMALILNITVVCIGIFFFWRKQRIVLKEFWPFLVFSIPSAFLGATIPLAERTFFIILAILLIAASLSMLAQVYLKLDKEKNLGLTKKAGLSLGIGFLSGVSGIGGGIFLSPSLNLLSWKNTKMIAALSSVFILSNSISGILGLLYSGNFKVDFSLASSLILAVSIGGILGSFLTNNKLNISVVRILTAILVASVGIRLLIVHFVILA